MKQRCDDLIALHGSVRKALESRRECVARRCREGKQSPVAVQEIKALLEMEKPALHYTQYTGYVMARCPIASIEIRLEVDVWTVRINGLEMEGTRTFATLDEAKLAAENHLLEAAKRTYDILMK